MLVRREEVVLDSDINSQDPWHEKLGIGFFFVGLAKTNETLFL